MTCPWCLTPVDCREKGCACPLEPKLPWWRRLFHVHWWHHTDGGMFGDLMACRCGAETYDWNLPWQTEPKWLSRKKGYCK